MFWKKKDQQPMLPVSSAYLAAGAPHRVEENALERGRTQAKVFVEESRARFLTAGNKIASFGETGYWWYGYFISSMSVTMAGSLLLSNRFAYVGRYSGWIALLGGYAGATSLMYIHKMFLLRDYRIMLEKEIQDAHRLDEETMSVHSEYRLLIRQLEGVLKSLTRDPKDMMAPQQQEEESAHEIAARFAKKMNWNLDKMGKQSAN